jgi:RNA polymerase sigma-70 factor, ECF subfamily
VQQDAPPEAGSRDQDIVELLRGGAVEAAFERLVDRYERKVYRLCCSLLRDPNRAEDAAQESLVRVWKALAKYDERASLSTWIYTITRNRCLTAIERHRQLDSLSDPAVEHEAEVAQAVGPEVEQDHLAVLREMVDALPERFRRALILFYYQERSVAEVAQMLGQPEGTVKTNLHRARAALVEQMRRAGLANPEFWLERAE